MAQPSMDPVKPGWRFQAELMRRLERIREDENRKRSPLGLRPLSQVGFVETILLDAFDRIEER